MRVSLRHYAMSCVAALGIISAFCGRIDASAVPPDSSTISPANPSWSLTEMGPANAAIMVWPTNQGNRIKNANGQEVEFVDVITFGTSSRVRFTIPGLVNGLPTTDAQQKTGNPGAPADPGTLFMSVFTGGIMTTNSLGKWLSDNGYANGLEIFMPDFFPIGFSDVYYGVDLATLANAGQMFVGGHSFGDTFIINASGTLPALPMYTFSSTPLVYTPGIGWSGTPLSSGTQVQYGAFHTASAIPEPATAVLFVAGIFGIGMLHSRRRLAQRRK
jgi:hypothetical protein